MKPDWRNAPEWARWLSQDDCGEWCWFENEPALHEGRHGAFWADPQFGECETASLGGDERCIVIPLKEPRP